MCGLPLPTHHRHLIDPASRRLTCSCDACALLFPQNGVTKYKSVPRRLRFLAGFQLTDTQWDNLLIPIGLAFFFQSSIEKRVLGLFPSPAGTTECTLGLNSWADIVADNPVLNEMEPDVEALLINRLHPPAECYLVPIDKCYELSGLIRANWHGLSGGPQMWERVQDFFASLKEISRA